MMRKVLTILVCILFASSDAQDTCGSPAMTPRDSTSDVVSTPRTFYFYRFPFSSSCVGTVVAYEFCYSYTPTIGPGLHDDVTIVVTEILEGGNFSVVWTASENTDGNCTTDTDIEGVVRCCGRTDLASDETFSVTTNNAYGFIIRDTQNTLLTLETNDIGGVFVLRLADLPIINPDFPSVGSTLTLLDLVMYATMASQSLQQRSFQFIIQQPSSPTSNPTTDSNVTPNPSLTTTSPSPNPGSNVNPLPNPTSDSNVTPNPSLTTTSPSPNPGSNVNPLPNPTSDSNVTPNPSLTTTSPSPNPGSNVNPLPNPTSDSNVTPNPSLTTTSPSPNPGSNVNPLPDSTSDSNVTPNPSLTTTSPSPNSGSNVNPLPNPTSDSNVIPISTPTPDTPSNPGSNVTLPSSDSNVTPNPSPTGTPNPNSSRRSGGTSAGTIAAAVVVPLLVIGGVAIATVVAIVIWRRRYGKSEMIAYDNGCYTLIEGDNFQRTKSEPHYSTQSTEESYSYPDLDQGRRLNQDPQEYLQPVFSLTPSITTVKDLEDTYEDPASDEISLYNQIKRMNLRHIKRDAIKIIDHLGSGQFGTVNRGEWESPDGTVEVAVKMLIAGSAEDNRVKFLREAAIMGQFQHHNVVKLYGVVIIGEPKMLVLELLAKGDLHNYLVSLQPEDGEMVDPVSELPHTLLSFSRQVASGLAYLAGKDFVHRDLAARNILVAEDGERIKIADFGMSRDLMDEDYYVAHGGKIPVKWTAPEAIHFRKYSTASDVWSFGVVIFEIWSLGHKPFEGYSNGQALSMVDRRLRLAPPPGCPRAIYDIIIKCWHPDAAQRPSAANISHWLSRPDPQLLRWSEEDRAVHPQASLLGAELETTLELYKELQDSYF